MIKRNRPSSVTGFGLAALCTIASLLGACGNDEDTPASTDADTTQAETETAQLPGELDEVVDIDGDRGRGNG